jgi:hypothetical protein
LETAVRAVPLLRTWLCWARRPRSARSTCNDEPWWHTAAACAPTRTRQPGACLTAVCDVDCRTSSLGAPHQPQITCIACDQGIQHVCGAHHARQQAFSLGGTMQLRRSPARPRAGTRPPRPFAAAPARFRHAQSRIIATRSSLVETISFDQVGKLTWDSAIIDDSTRSELLESFQLRQGQVRGGAGSPERVVGCCMAAVPRRAMPRVTQRSPQEQQVCVPLRARACAGDVLHGRRVCVCCVRVCVCVRACVVQCVRAPGNARCCLCAGIVAQVQP